MLIDTHAHLNAHNYRANLPEIIDEAKNSGVSIINVVCYYPKTNYLANKISSKYCLYSTCVLHPSSIHNFT